MEGSLEFVYNLLALHLVVEERQVHIHLVGLMVQGVAILEEDIAVVALVALGAHQIQLTHWRRCHRGIGHLHAIVLLADGCDKTGCLELKAIKRGIIFCFSAILAIIILEKLFKVS